MTSYDSSVNELLTGYLAGRVTAAQMISAVTAEFYRKRGNGTHETLRPIIEVVERVHPGVVELKASDERPGFAVRLAERPFPKRHEADLREAVERVLQTSPVSGVPFPDTPQRKPGLFQRLVAAIRKVFSS
ncbi:MAG TPA: hypothetical protein VG454_13285 [Gemmatimonadales bacterium]|nr:hypothetical protein [Gemmatimonadales bacterium]